MSEQPGQGEGQGEGQQADSGQQGDGQGAVTRAEFDGLEAKLDRILEGIKPGQSSAAAEPAGPSIAEQVRAGIDELEAKRKADESAAADKAKGDDTERRLRALEERPPGPADTWMSRLQRRMYGTEPDGSATPRKTRQRAASGQQGGGQ